MSVPEHRNSRDTPWALFPHWPRSWLRHTVPPGEGSGTLQLLTDGRQRTRLQLQKADWDRWLGWGCAGTDRSSRSNPAKTISGAPGGGRMLTKAHQVPEKEFYAGIPRGLGPPLSSALQGSVTLSKFLPILCCSPPLCKVRMSEVLSNHPFSLSDPARMSPVKLSLISPLLYTDSYR